MPTIPRSTAGSKRKSADENQDENEDDGSDLTKANAAYASEMSLAVRQMGELIGAISPKDIAGADLDAEKFSGQVENREVVAFAEEFSGQVENHAVAGQVKGQGVLDNSPGQPVHDFPLDPKISQQTPPLLHSPLGPRMSPQTPPLLHYPLGPESTNLGAKISEEETTEGTAHTDEVICSFRGCQQGRGEEANQHCSKCHLMCHVECSHRYFIASAICFECEEPTSLPSYVIQRIGEWNAKPPIHDSETVLMSVKGIIPILRGKISSSSSGFDDASMTDGLVCGSVDQSTLLSVIKRIVWKAADEWVFEGVDESTYKELVSCGFVMPNEDKPSDGGGTKQIEMETDPPKEMNACAAPGCFLSDPDRHCSACNAPCHFFCAHITFHPYLSDASTPQLETINTCFKCRPESMLPPAFEIDGAFESQFPGEVKVQKVRGVQPLARISSSEQYETNGELYVLLVSAIDFLQC